MTVKTLKTNKNQKVSFSLISKTKGILTKRMELKSGGVEKDGSECWMSKGRSVTVTLAPEAFGPFLQGLKSNQALVHGVSAFDKAGIVSGSKLKTKPGETPQTDRNGLPIISRTKAFFHHPDGPGVLMLDYDKARENAVALDPDKALKAHSPEELISIIAEFFQPIKGAAQVAVCSTSSCIYETATGKELRGRSAGFHLYLFPLNAADAPRFLNVLGQRLMLAGYGRVEFSRSGAVLMRTPVDLLVASPERLDFVAGAVCDKGLEQRRPDPEYQPGGLLDTETLNDLTPEEEAAYQEIIRELKAKGASDQERIKGAYLDQEAEKLSSKSEGKISMEQARETVTARQHHILADNDLLLFAHLKEPVSVAHALDNGPEFDKKSCADPLEPEYDGGSMSKAVFYWNDGGNPIVNSQAHGGIKYRFARIKAERESAAPASAVSLESIIEATTANCGAVYEKSNLRFLAELKRDNPASFAFTRNQLKKIDGVGITELNQQVKNFKLPKKKKEIPLSQDVLDAISNNPKYKLEIEKAHRSLIFEGKKENKRLQPQSKGAATFARLLKNKFSYSSVMQEWFAFDESQWVKCEFGEYDQVSTALLYSASEELGFTSTYQVGINEIMVRQNFNPLPKPKAGTIPFKNGILDQDTGKLDKITPENAHTWHIPYDYTPDAKCQKFQNWLSSSLDGDEGSIHLIRAWFYCLLTGMQTQKFLHLLGPGGSGKSTLLRLANRLVNEKNVATTTLKELETNRFETASFQGKRLVSISEAEKYGGDVTVLKALTGGDVLRNEKKNKQQATPFVNTAPVIMLGNEAIATTDQTSGLERRRITVDFKHRISEEEKIAWEAAGGEEAILHAEAGGIIAWILELTPDIVTTAFRLMPDRVLRANLDAQIAGGTVADWVFNKTKPASGNKLQVGAISEGISEGRKYWDYEETRAYPNYLQYCKSTGKKAVALGKFGATVEDIIKSRGVDFHRQKTRPTYQEPGVSSNAVACLVGVRLISKNEDSWFDELTIPKEIVDIENILNFGSETPENKQEPAFPKQDELFPGYVPPQRDSHFDSPKSINDDEEEADFVV
jgi:putative DNA primase/helicase